MPPLLAQLLGYAAAVLVFCTFYMHTMLPLRYVGVASNVAFMAYAWPLRLYPIAILHSLMLALNSVRILQIKRFMRTLSEARSSDIDLKRFAGTLRSETHAAGAVIFRRGDASDCAFYIESGEIELPEIDARIGRGQLLGEIGIFAHDGARTASARCVTVVVLYRVSADELATAFFQTPALAFAILRLVIQRMSANIEHLEAEVGRLKGALEADKRT